MVKSFDRISDLSTRMFPLCGKTVQGSTSEPGHAAGEVDSDPDEEVVVNATAVRANQDSHTAC